MSDNKEYTLNDYNSGKTLYDFIQEQLLDIDTSELTDDVNNDVQIEISPEVVYFWTRIYLKDENPNIEIGDIVDITYLPSGEKLKTQFITWGKKGLERDHEDEVINYNQEDDKKIICLMIEEKVINESEDIPFIRTLFKLGRHYEHNIIRRHELQFTVSRNGIILDYYDCDF